MSGATSEAALQRALKFLGFRARSEQEVRVKLTQLGFPQRTVEATLNRLRNLSLLNDEQLARDLALSRAKHGGYGHLRIERELLQKGISKSLTQRILSETVTEQGEKENAMALLEKKFKNKDLNDLRILRQADNFLHQRGYSDSLITELLKRSLDNY